MIATIGGHEIHYDIAGAAGAPVVCLAHSLSADSGIWSDQLPALLAEGWQVLRLDMRGHGGSRPVAGEATMDELALDVIGVLDFLDLAQIHFIGVSIGGMIGQLLAIDHGARLRSMVICNTSPKSAPGARSMWEARLAQIRAASSVEPLADETMQRWFTAGFKARRPERFRQVRETIARTSPEGYRAAATAIIDFDASARLGSVKVPTLVLCGADDPGSPPEGNREIAKRIPGGRYEEIADARHIPMLEHPEIFNRLMLDWLRSKR
jgi:3-oxoadipate enol-lactonase